jgi:hypothetical protein
VWFNLGPSDALLRLWPCCTGHVSPLAGVSAGSGVSQSCSSPPRLPRRSIPAKAGSRPQPAAPTKSRHSFSATAEAPSEGGSSTLDFSSSEVLLTKEDRPETLDFPPSTLKIQASFKPIQGDSSRFKPKIFHARNRAQRNALPRCPFLFRVFSVIPRFHPSRMVFHLLVSNFLVPIFLPPFFCQPLSSVCFSRLY